MGFGRGKKKLKKIFGKAKTAIRNNPQTTAKVLQGVGNIAKNNKAIVNQYKKLHPNIRGKISAVYKKHAL